MCHRCVQYPVVSISTVADNADQHGVIDRRCPLPHAKKSFPLSSTTTNAGKSSTSIFQTASMPSSG